MILNLKTILIFILIVFLTIILKLVVISSYYFFLNFIKNLRLFKKSQIIIGLFKILSLFNFI